MIHKSSTALERPVKMFYLRALTGCTNLTLSSDVDSLTMTNGDPRDRFLYPTLTLMMDQRLF